MAWNMNPTATRRPSARAPVSRGAIAAAAVLLFVRCAPALGASTLPASGEPEGPVDYRRAWLPLVDQRAFDRARTLCEGWLAIDDVVAQTEGHKCLANADLGEARVRRPENESPGGPPVVPRYEGPGVDRALRHVNKAIALSPDDLSTHLGRIALLIRSNRIAGVAPAFQESLRLYHGPDALDHWLQIPAQIFESEQYELALELYRMLEVLYPSSHKVLENVGVVFRHLGWEAEALAYLEKAVALAPDDPLDNWNLAGAYDAAERHDAAEVYYRKAISLQPVAETKVSWTCDFSHFLEIKRLDRDAACELQKSNCPPESRTACSTLVEPPPEMSREPGGSGN